MGEADLMGWTTPKRSAEVPKLKPPGSDTPPRARRAAAAEETPRIAPPPEPSPFLGLVMSPPPSSALPLPQDKGRVALAVEAQRGSGSGGGTFSEMGPSGSAPASRNPFEALVTEQSRSTKPSTGDPFAGLFGDIK